jgi:SAM-dependent methyltransferase
MGLRLKARKVLKAAAGTVIPRYRETSMETVLGRLRLWNDDQKTPCYSFNHYQQFMHALRKWGAGDPRAVLELGPGAQLGTLYCFLVGGATRAAGLDIAPTSKDPAFFRRLNEYLKHVSGFRWWRPSDAVIGYHYPHASWDDVDVEALVDKIEYYAPYEGNDTPFADGEFDFVYSGAALEHFDKPRETAREIYRILEPGGMTVHGIDLRSHAPGGDLSHLRMSEEDYKRATQKYDRDHGINNIIEGQWTDQPYCNRVLAHQWRGYFEEAGFEVLSLDVLLQLDPAAIRPRDFAEPFSNFTSDQLAPLVIGLVARKPN